MRPWACAAVGAGLGAAVAAIAWIFVARALDQKLAEGVAQLSSGVSAGRTELARRLRAGRAELTSAVRERIDAELPRAIQDVVRTKVPPMVRSTLTATLSDYGITPTTGRQLAAVLAYADRLGVI